MTVEEENLIKRYLRGASPEELACIDELAELDRLYGVHPVPADHVYRSGKTARQTMEELEANLTALGIAFTPHRWPT